MSKRQEEESLPWLLPRPVHAEERFRPSNHMIVSSPCFAWNRVLVDYVLPNPIFHDNVNFSTSRPYLHSSGGERLNCSYYTIGHFSAVLVSTFFFTSICFSLDELLVSTLDQQKLQSILSSVTTKCDVSSLLQEAKAQAEVSLGQAKMKTIPDVSCGKRWLMVKGKQFQCSHRTTFLEISPISAQDCSLYVQSHIVWSATVIFQVLPIIPVLWPE